MRLFETARSEANWDAMSGNESFCRSKTLHHMTIIRLEQRLKETGTVQDLDNARLQPGERMNMSLRRLNNTLSVNNTLCY